MRYKYLDQDNTRLSNLGVGEGIEPRACKLGVVEMSLSFISGFVPLS